jgi:hypothetical protein
MEAEFDSSDSGEQATDVEGTERSSAGLRRSYAPVREGRVSALGIAHGSGRFLGDRVDGIGEG